MMIFFRLVFHQGNNFDSQFPSKRHVLPLPRGVIDPMLTDFPLFFIPSSLSIPACVGALWVERGEESQVHRPHDPRVLERGSHHQDHRPGHLQDDQVGFFLSLHNPVCMRVCTCAHIVPCLPPSDTAWCSPSSTTRSCESSWWPVGRRSVIRVAWRTNQPTTAMSVMWVPPMMIAPSFPVWIISHTSSASSWQSLNVLFCFFKLSCWDKSRKWGRRRWAAIGGDTVIVVLLSKQKNKREKE